ncbi:25068_t:CDS:2, partial [Racocetra persica]
CLINCFIDGGRMLSTNDLPNTKPMTTNNLTEQMNKSVEGQCVGTQPINHFIERLYGITLILDNIIKEISLQLVFEAVMIEQECLYVILHSVKPAVEGSDIYFYVKKRNSEFRSPYTMRRISINDKSSKLLQLILNELAFKHPVV